MFESAGVDFASLARSLPYRKAFLEVTFVADPAEGDTPRPVLNLDPDKTPPEGYRAVLGNAKPRIASMFIPVAATAMREAVKRLEGRLPFEDLPVFMGVRSMKDWGDVCSSTPNLQELRSQVNAKRRECLEIVDTLKRKAEVELASSSDDVPATVASGNSSGKRTRKSTLFVASSREALHLARAIQAELHHEVDVTLWNQGFFEASKHPMETLEQRAAEFDMAALVMQADDVVCVQKSEVQT